MRIIQLIALKSCLVVLEIGHHQRNFEILKRRVLKLQKFIDKIQRPLNVHLNVWFNEHKKISQSHLF